MFVARLNEICRPGQWKCAQGGCILNRWKCNGGFECLDKSDEPADCAGYQ